MKYVSCMLLIIWSLPGYSGTIVVYGEGGNANTYEWIVGNICLQNGKSTRFACNEFWDKYVEFCPNRKPKYEKDICNLEGVPSKMPIYEEVSVRNPILNREIMYIHFDHVCMFEHAGGHFEDRECDAFNTAKKMCDGTYIGVECKLKN